MLAKAHRLVLIDDASHFNHVAHLQPEIILVPNHACGCVVPLRDCQLVVSDSLDTADEGDGSAYETIHVGCSDERVRLTMHVLYFFAHLMLNFCFCFFAIINLY